MAQHLEAKGAGETVQRRYTLAGVASVSLSASGVTASAEIEGDDVVFTLSAGTAGTTGTITATMTNDDAETLVKIFYLPIVAPDATGMTVRDVCEFALRKVYGKDETPEASALSDAMERLSDMLRAWGWTGADVGASFPLAEASVLYVRPEFQQAIKANLILEIADLYDLPISIKTAQNALRGMQLIKTANLSDDRPGADYY